MISSPITDQIARISARRAFWRMVRQVSLASLVFVYAVWFEIWPPNVVWLLSLLCLGVLITEKPRQVARHIDKTGGLSGLVECAVDHLSDEGPVILAQRARAGRAIADRPVAFYAPAPKLMWWVPILALLVIAALKAQNAPKSLAVNATGSSQAPIDPPTEAVGPSAVAATKTRKKSKANSRAKAGDTYKNDTLTAGPNTEPQVAGKGRQTGKVGGGDSVGRMMPLEGNGQKMVLSPMFKERKNAASSESGDAIAEPARPFPKKYHDVIEAWFRRRDR